MNHLTNVYKHKCEQLQEQIKNITKMLNEAEGTADPTVLYPTATDMTELGKGAMPGRIGDGKAFRAQRDGGYGYTQVPDVNLIPFIISDLDKRLQKYARANPELFLAEILENIPGPYATPQQIVAFLLAHEVWIDLFREIFNMSRPVVLALFEMIKNNTASQADLAAFNNFYSEMYELGRYMTVNPEGYNTNAGTAEGQDAYRPDRTWRGKGDGIFYQPPISPPSQYVPRKKRTPPVNPYGNYGPGM